ncbi:MAG: GntR family transcriptional regulator [Clostridiales bacterium]|nr:GntR family transcriptional regulator [Clostridiales bacterium]
MSNTLRTAITEGEYKSGSRLPTEQQLMEQFGVSRQTVRNALEILTKEGLIQRRQGSGTVVLEQKPKSENNTIAIVISFANSYIFPSLLMDAQQVLLENGFSALVYGTDNQFEKERKILLQLLEHPVRGMIVEGTKSALPNPNLDLYRQLRDSGVPMVFLHSCYPELSAPVFRDDDESGGYLAAQHLLQKGHTRIGGIFKLDDRQGILRFSGMMHALKDAEVSFQEESIFWYDTNQRVSLVEQGATGWLEDYAAQLVRSCTAVICYNDEIAYRLLDILLHAGVRVPQQLSIISFDNSHYSSLGAVGLTSLAPDPGRLGTLSAQGILELVRGKQAQSQKLPWKLVTRKST